MMKDNKIELKKHLTSKKIKILISFIKLHKWLRTWQIVSHVANDLDYKNFEWILQD